MTRIVQFQTNFSVGELDPLLKARTDLQQYQNALEKATNIYIQPQGGVRRRDGLRFVHSFGSGFTAFKVIPFEYNVIDSYTLVFVDLRMYVFKAGVLQTDINGSGNDYATTTITAAMLDDLNYTQAVDTLILCHEDLETQRILRNSDTSWTVSALPLAYIPKHAYSLDTHEPTFTITPSQIDGNITITASAVTTETGTAQGVATAGSTNTLTVKASSSYADDQPNGMFINITAGTGAGQTRHIEDFVAATKVLTVYPDWDTAPDATSQYRINAFEAAAVDEYANILNGFGRARYTEFVSHTQMKAYVEIPFFDTSAITAGNWESEHGYEPTWSASRGWPRSAAFHEGRLYFGGSKSRPNTIWGSRVIDYFNFNPGSTLDDDSVEATINTNQLNVITNLVPGPDLQVFTTGGEFVVSQAANTPITPSSFLVKPQTRLGSKPGVPMEDLNGATVFVQRQGRSLVSFQFQDTTAAYSTQALSVLSSHLIKVPIDLAARRATSTDETDRLFLVNGDGTMAVYSILAAQNVIAPSEFTTNGDFIAVACEIDEIYVIVKRVIDGTTSYNLELFDPSLTVDSAKSGGAAASVNMDHLTGGEVQIIRDGIVEPTQTVPASPYTVTFERAATSSYQVGLAYDIQIKTMPAEPRLAQGTLLGTKKRILQVDAIVYESQNMSVNGKLIAFRNFGENVLDSAVQEFTGTKTVSGLLGFSNTGQIEISQTAPLKLTLLGLEYRMSVGN